MDPFSLIVGTASLLDILVRVGKGLIELKNAVGKGDEEIEALRLEIDKLTSIYKSFESTFKLKLQTRPDYSIEDHDEARQFWHDTRKTWIACSAEIERLEELLQGILREGVTERDDKVKPHAFQQKLDKLKFDKLKPPIRKFLKEGKLTEIRCTLSYHQNTLHFLLTAINLTYNLESQLTRNHLYDINKKLSIQLESLQSVLTEPHQVDLQNSMVSAKTALSLASLASPNKHFRIPAVSSIFTGREGLLKELRMMLFAPSAADETLIQKRFVVLGLSGSGKTQFCWKFAQDYRQNFWGVFRIDASSEEQAKVSFSEIAEIGGCERTERAAKAWLTQLEDPWLLIIDNADDPQLPMENFFPGGERGHILITTRTSRFKNEGTIGCKYFHFRELESEDASHLLLKAAATPYDDSTKDLASSISQTLGYIPLALVQAGGQIAAGICHLTGFLDYYANSWKDLRQNLRRNRRALINEGDEFVKRTYLTSEMSYNALRTGEAASDTDAIELLKMFSFLYRENIRFDLLTRAAAHSRLEKPEEKDSVKPEIPTFSNIRFAISGLLYMDRASPVLPQVLRDIEAQEQVNLTRLQNALGQLVRLALIEYNHINSSYRIHPLVHTWIRERMTTAERAIWCQAAATTLAQSILIRPLGDREANEDFQRSLLPHIIQVQKYQREIQNEFAENRKELWLIRRWMMPKPWISVGQALQMVKYGMVYAQCGSWKEAEELITTARDLFKRMLPPEDPRFIRIQRGLALIYWKRGRGSDAAELQERVLQDCIHYLKTDHRTTLEVMDSLGQSEWMRGRFRQAQELHEKAIQGMTKVLGADHEDTLKAIDHLGRVHSKYFEYNKAKDLHSKAVDRMKDSKALGPMHEDTQEAMINLAMTYLILGGEDLLKRAQDLLEVIVEQRKKKLGTIHPYTLWATLNLARVQSARGYLDEAEEAMRAGLVIAERYLGDTHIGSLYGKSRLGQLLVKRGRYSEAEEVLQATIEKYKHMDTANEDGEHPDRVAAMWYLSHCYRLQGRIDDAITICERAIEGLKGVGGVQHPFMTLLQKTLEALRDPEDKGDSLDKGESLRNHWTVF